MAKITAEGSFSYLTDKKVFIYLDLFVGFYMHLHKINFQDHKQVDMASLHYMSQTKTETLNGDLARKVLFL